MQKSNAETMFPQPSNGNFNFDVPEITHHAPQVFGAFNPDGSPMPAVLPGQIFQENGEAGSLDELDAKRRRIARVQPAEQQRSRRMAVADIIFTGV